MFNKISDCFRKFNNISPQINKNLANWIIGILIFAGIVLNYVGCQLDIW